MSPELRGRSNFYMCNNIEYLSEYLEALPAQTGQVDCVELFGGAGGVIKVLISRKFKCGKNFDLLTGWDLSKPSHAEAFSAYVNRYRPIVVVMAPPCTLFNELARLFGHKWPKFEARLRAAKKLAILAATVAFLQLSQGRHFIIENPLRSRIWLLQLFKKLISHSCTCAVVIDQCEYGLRVPRGSGMLRNPLCSLLLILCQLNI